jgi:monothiol glutaredoxin
MALTEPVRQQLSDLLAAHRVVLFMKGTRQSPQCGFSAQVVQILDECLVNYETIDVLRSPQLRNGIKQFSDWPTIPQVYIDGKFIGGCDIVREMNASGDASQTSWREARSTHHAGDLDEQLGHQGARGGPCRRGQRFAAFAD